MPIVSRKIEIRVSYVAVTQKGREIHDCVTYPIEEFMTDPANVKIGTQKVLTDISARLERYDEQRDAADKAVAETPEPTEDERFEQVLISLGESEAERFKAWLVAKEESKGEGN